MYLGHRATECTELYDLWGDNVNVIDDADEAWRHVLQADADDDLDDFKQVQPNISTPITYIASNPRVVTLF